MVFALEEGMGEGRSMARWVCFGRFDTVVPHGCPFSILYYFFSLL
jgi:hypothetical protein